MSVKKHRSCYKKPMMTCLAFTNLNLSYGTLIKNWLLLAEDDNEHYSLCKKVLCIPNSYWLSSKPSEYFTVALGLFKAWSIDVVGPIFLPPSKGHRYILVIIDYFSKRLEAIILKALKASDMVKFIKKKPCHLLIWYSSEDSSYQQTSICMSSFLQAMQQN